MKNTGSRAEVFHEKALKTSGGLHKTDLIKNKHGYIVSKRKVNLSRRLKTNPLMAQGYLAKRKSNKFGPAKNKPRKSMMQKIYTMFE
jgi:hypothetical protein